MRKYLLVSKCIILLLFPFIGYSIIRDVPASYPTISDALTACQSFDTILVQPGTYSENIVWNNSIVQGIKLLSVSGSANTIISAPSGRVFSIYGGGYNDSMAVINGFTIRGGTIADSVNNLLMGAGMFLKNTNLAMSDVIVKENSITGTSNANCYGAGIYFKHCMVKFTHSEITNNRIIFGGLCFGAGIKADSSKIYMYDCLVNNNVLDSGGTCRGAGIYGDSLDVLIVNSRIFDNEINFSGMNEGAGIYFKNTISNLNHCDITGNKSITAQYNYGGGICHESGLCSLSKCNISRNRIFPTPNHYNGGSALYIEASAAIENCKITENISDSSNSSYASAILIEPSNYDTIEVNIYHCTIANNIAGTGLSGYGIFVYGSLNWSVKLHLINSILWNPNVTELFINQDSLQISNCDIRTNSYGGTMTFSSNPLFSGTHDYHLTYNSPCVNAGTMLLGEDIDFHFRPMPATHNPDIGCYEVDENQLTSPATANSNTIQIRYFQNREIYIYSFDGTYQIFDYSGRLLYNNHLLSPESEVDVSGLQNGIYFLRTISRLTNVSTYKFVISK